MSKLENEIYTIIDSFLIEAKDQNGNERSLETLNEDRRLAAEKFLELIEKQKEEIKQKLLANGHGGGNCMLDINLALLPYKNIILLWDEFLKEWIPEHTSEDKQSFYKPEFYDFMRWLSNKLK